MFNQVFLLSLLIQHAFPDCQCGLRNEFERALIYGGEDAEPGEYPWQAFIQTIQVTDDEDDTIWKSTCGGSIINTEWILTAAHCLPNSSEFINEVVQTDIFVRVGRVNNADLEGLLQPWIDYRSNIGPRPDMSTLNENGVYLVDRWISHEEYTNKTSGETGHNITDVSKYSEDIALLHIQTPINISATTRPVCLETLSSAQTFYPTVELAGWGDTSNNTEGSVHLQCATVSEVKFEDCFWSTMNASRQMCFNSGSPGGCEGDSGSPYVVKKNGRFYQIAIMSIADGVRKCSENSVERLGIRVASFYNWIREMADSGTWCSP